jgi:hypothetical protein
MSRPALRLAHAVSGGLATLTIATLWMSTVVVELTASPDSIVSLKRAIPWALLLLVPALAATGVTGTKLTRNARGRLVRRKLLRMRVVAALGMLVLMPCVLYLGLTASVENLNATFYAVQAVELAAGSVNIVLLGLNSRDGLRLTGGLRRKHTSLRPPVPASNR